MLYETILNLLTRFDRRNNRNTGTRVSSSGTAHSLPGAVRSRRNVPPAISLVPLTTIHVSAFPLTSRTSESSDLVFQPLNSDRLVNRSSQRYSLL